MDKLRGDVQSRMAEGDFKRADGLLQEIREFRLNSGQNREVNDLRARLRKTSFLYHHPLALKIQVPSKVFAFGEKIPLSFEVFNLSDQALQIPGSGGSSWLPWGEKRKSLIMIQINLSEISAYDGVKCTGNWNPVIELDHTWVIPPGDSRHESHVLDLTAPSDRVYRRLEIKARLMPGGLQAGPFDWGMISLDFQPLTLHVFQGQDLVLTLDPEDSLAWALEEKKGREILITSLFLDNKMPWPAVDEIMGMMPGFPRGLQRALLVSLSWLSNQDMGYDLNRWMDWWEVNRGQLLGSGASGQEKPDDPSVLPVELPEEASRVRKGSRKSLQGPAALPPLLAGLLCTLPSIPISASLARPSNESPAEGADTENFRVRLSNPYYGRRCAARKRLEAMGMDGFPILQRLMADESPRIRCQAAMTLGTLHHEEVLTFLVQSLRKEKDKGVKQQIVQALALIESDTRISAELLLPRDQPDNDYLRKLYVDRAIMKAIEDTMHFNEVPGFFDGQFNAFWEISEDVFLRLVEIARDSDYSYQARVLSIMSLHEQKKHPILPALHQLLIKPTEELDIEWEEFITFPMDEDLIYLNRKRSLSKYARFSLAKAGYTNFNKQKILEMQRWLDRYGYRYLERNAVDNSGAVGGFDPTRTFVKSIMLDIAYNYQQFDAYNEAEHWYKKLIREFSRDKSTGIVAEAHYNLACLYSLTGEKALALKHLGISIDLGFLDLSWMERDRDLDNIREEPEFSALRDKVISKPLEVDPEEAQKEKE